MAGSFTGTTYNGDNTDETVTGTSAYETFYGAGGKDTLNGSGGNDSIYGGYGIDTLHGGTGDDYLYANTSLYDPVYPAEADRLYGDSGNDNLETRTSRTVKGGILDGGTDEDYAHIAVDAADGNGGFYDVSFTLTAAAAGSYLRFGAVGALLVKNVERLDYRGSGGKDTVTGGGLDDVIAGGDGDDVLSGGAGSDILAGGTGKQTIDGGADFDIASFDLSDATDSLTVIAGGTVDIGAHGTIKNIEAFSQVSTGSGNDTISVGYPQSGGRSFYSYVYAGAGNDTITGGAGPNIFYAGTGSDKVTGGGGDDSIVVDYDNKVSETSTTAGNDVAHGDDGADYLSGGIGKDALYGDAGADTIAYTGDFKTGTLADTFDGGADNDRLSLSLGTYAFAKVEVAIGASFAVKGDGQTLLNARSFEALSVNAYYGGADITATGGNLSDNIVTNSGDDVVKTLGGDDTVNTDRGTDTVDAGAGKDMVTAYVGGRDIIKAGADDDVLTLYNDARSEALNYQALYDAGDGNDKLVYYESDSVTDSFDGTYLRQNSALAGKVINYESLTYNGSSRGTKFGGTSHDDTIHMAGGNDTASGGGGNDIIQGGGGDDTLDGGDGTSDTVDYSDKGSGFLGGVPNLTIVLKGSTASTVAISSTDVFGNTTSETDTFKNFENAIGGAGNDTITGDNAANVIDGGGGNDVLKGLAGADTFAFSYNYSIFGNQGEIDHIGDFSTSDFIRLDKTRFFGLAFNATTGELSTTSFKDIGKTGAKVDADDRIIYNSKTGDLSFDADGSGTYYNAVQFAKLDNKFALTYHDILVV